MLTPETLPNIQRALTEAGVDGWLLYDFRGLNPIAAGILDGRQSDCTCYSARKILLHPARKRCGLILRPWESLY